MDDDVKRAGSHLNQTLKHLCNFLNVCIKLLELYLPRVEQGDIKKYTKLLKLSSEKIRSAIPSVSES